MFPGCRWFNFVLLALVGTVSLPVKCSCPPVCRCSNVSAICRSGLTVFPSGLPPGLTAISVSGTYSSRNNIPSIAFSFFTSVSRLERLHMAFCRIETITDGALPSTLVTLNISYNRIWIISRSTLKNLIHLRQLHLTGNIGTDISHTAFNNLRRLKELYMADMGIKVFDKRLLEHLPMLKVLDLHGNKLKHLDWTFTETLNSLSYIDISGNLFSELSNSSIMTLRHIKSINLSNNNWKCNCALEWVKVLPSPIPESVDCSGPLSVRYLSIVNVPSSQLTCVPASVRCSTVSFTGKYHTQLNISCSFGGDPFPDVSWIRPDGVKLQYYNYDHPNYVVSETGMLTIKSLDILDDGRWTLHVNNVKKQNSVPLSVTVTGILTATTTTTTTTKGISTFSLTAPSTSSMTTITATFGNTLAMDSKSRGGSATVVCLTVLGSLVLVISIAVFFLCLFNVCGLRFLRRRLVHDWSETTQQTLHK